MQQLMQQVLVMAVNH